MKPEEKNLAYIWDMITESRQIIDFTKDVKFIDFENNKLIRYAVERSLLILGEAANHVSSQFQEDHPEIPWHQIIGQRNVLAHEYGDIKIERIWITVTQNIPPLIIELEKILNGEP